MLKRSELAEARQQTYDQLEDEIGKKRLRLYRLREKMVVEQLENPHDVRSLRRQIAQLKTIQAEKKK